MLLLGPSVEPGASRQFQTLARVEARDLQKIYLCPQSYLSYRDTPLPTIVDPERTTEEIATRTEVHMSFDPTEEYDDVNEAAVSDWKRETTARERIKAVIKQTTEPTSASGIAERAEASSPVVRDELDELTEIGLVEKIDGAPGTLYKRDDQMYIYQQVLRLHDEYSEDELVEMLQDLKQRVKQIRAEHDVESPAELAQQLDPDDHEGWEDHRTWQTAQKNLYLAKAAISFYDARKVVV